MEHLFQQLAAREGVKLHVEYERSFSKVIAFSPAIDQKEGSRIKTLSFTLPVERNVIEVGYNIGDGQFGKLACVFGSNSNLPEFTVSCRSHYLRLFLPRLNILKIDCEDSRLVMFLEDKFDKLGLEALARNSLFAPKIEGKGNNLYVIEAFYSLSFVNKKMELIPMVELFKSILLFAT